MNLKDDFKYIQHEIYHPRDTWTKTDTAVVFIAIGTIIYTIVVLVKVMTN